MAIITTLCTSTSIFSRAWQEVISDRVRRVAHRNVVLLGVTVDGHSQDELEEATEVGLVTFHNLGGCKTPGHGPALHLVDIRQWEL